MDIMCMNVILRRVRETIVTMENKWILYIFRPVCVCARTRASVRVHARF
jgi:hypothetical protein